jgi:DNA polymerase IIIc chi subunit
MTPILIALLTKGNPNPNFGAKIKSADKNKNGFIDSPEEVLEAIKNLDKKNIQAEQEAESVLSSKNSVAAEALLKSMLKIEQPFSPKVVTTWLNTFPNQYIKLVQRIYGDTQKVVLSFKSNPKDQNLEVQLKKWKAKEGVPNGWVVDVNLEKFEMTIEVKP